MTKDVTGAPDAGLDAALAELARRDIVRRIWRGDYSVWCEEATEITDRLGWLTVAGEMAAAVPELTAFGAEIAGASFRHVVLLGIGGSSLGPEVLRRSFGQAPGYPELIVLDSTVPGAVGMVRAAIDPAQTLFLVSSKSGTTVETLALYRFFHGLAVAAVGKDKAGQNFVAITDPATPLVDLATKAGFRRCFLNPPDIGGRYAVLSYVGLVAAALAGIDIVKLLDSAGVMRQACENADPGDNPGAYLGACLGAAIHSGRDKITLITSPAVSSFGLWVEQLLAESLGKDGRGLVPVIDEPSLETAGYGADRTFVYLRLSGDDNTASDKLVRGLEVVGKSVLTIEVIDCYDLGAEFYRWEFATAVSGALIGVHPFNQPDVQGTKIATSKILDEYAASGRLPAVTDSTSLADLLSRIARGKYLAILAYLAPTPAVAAALTDLRREIARRYGIATTLGYGPRYLHSTGQLHKGGLASGLFLQLTADHETDFEIPGMSVTFGVLADAEALGDLQALQNRGRSVARVNLGTDAAAAIRQLLVV